MHLDAYLSNREISNAAFAQLIGRDRTSVSRWRRGASIPDWTALKRITEATEGQVTANDFVEAGADRHEADPLVDADSPSSTTPGER
jgi:DNA-binding transcriptional regulator YdaS (Cro superfamily)